MGNPKTSKTLAQDFLVAEVGKADKLDSETQKEAFGSSHLFDKHNGSVSDSKILAVNAVGRLLCNVEAPTRVVQGGEEMEGVEGEISEHGSDSLVGDGDTFFDCIGSENGSLVDESVTETSVQVNSVDSHLAAPHKQGEEGPNGSENTPGTGESEEDDASQLKLPDSAKKVEAYGDGISLFVEVRGPPTKFAQDDGLDICLGLEAIENKEDNGGAECEKQACDNPNHHFSVGDIIWVKTKVESWWPGKICDPVNFPNYAVERPNNGSLLVRYIGNGNFAWCSPSQLKHFSDNFEEMSKEGKSRNFKVAVEKAVDEIGRHVESEMTCACRLKEICTPLSVELETDSKTGKISVIKFEPTDFLARLKFLSLDVCMPSALEFTIVQAHLSAFLSSVGHSKLPMHVLQGASDAENSSRENLPKKSNFTDEIKYPNPRPAKESSGNGSSHSIPLQKQSGVSDDEALKKDENESKLSCLEKGDGGSEGKTEKGFELRERKRSKYLSPPYVNLGFGRNNLPVSGDSETEDPRDPKGAHEGLDMDPDGEESGCPPIVKCSCKKRKGWSSKLNNNFVDEGGDNPSSAELLSEVQFAALDCHYPSENTKFDSIERFVSRFRGSVFHDDYSCEMCCKHIADQAEEIQHSLPADKSVPKKRKLKAITTLVNSTGEVAVGDKGAANVELSSTKLTPSGSLAKDQTPKVKSDQKLRKKKEQKNLKWVFDFGGGDLATTSSSLINGSLGETLIAFNNIPEDRSEKEGPTVDQPQANLMDGIPDLNGNVDIAASVVEDTEFMGFVSPKAKLIPKKKRAKEEEASSDHSKGGIPAELANVRVAETISVQNNLEGKETATKLCSNAKFTSVLEVVNGKPEVKKRKRRPKGTLGQLRTTNSAGIIPDLNGNGDEIGSVPPETNSLSQDAKPAPKKRRRKRSEFPDLSTSFFQMGTDGETPGTALLLAFARDFPIPSEESLISTFSIYGPLIESETQVLKDSSTARVVFSRSSDAGDAFRSLEKTKPFGPALTNYKLHNHSGASRSLEQDQNLRMPQTPRSAEGLVVPTKPSSLNPQLGEAPSLSCIRQNLEMMTSMLEKSGSNLSPEMRAKLESEIKNLLKKVSTKTGASAS